MLRHALAEFDSAYDELFALIEAYPAEKRAQGGACGVWSPQQVLAHLCGWLQEAHRRYDRFPRGTGDYQYNRDAFNAVSVKRRSAQSWGEIVAELRRLVTTLHDRTVLVQPTPLAPEARYAEWLQGLAHDARAHTLDLRQFIA